jgi:hypothetical protein
MISRETVSFALGTAGMHCVRIDWIDAFPQTPQLELV